MLPYTATFDRGVFDGFQSDSKIYLVEISICKKAFTAITVHGQIFAIKFENSVPVKVPPIKILHYYRVDICDIIVHIM